MIRTRDEKINEILDRAEEYRKRFQENVYHKKTINPDVSKELEKIFKAIFNKEECTEYKDKNNLKKGCTKLGKRRRKQ